MKLPKNQAAMSALKPVGLGRPKKDPADTLRTKALKGLGRRVAGFASVETKTTYEVDCEGGRVMKNEVVVRKQTPPDLPAIIFTLTNLDGERWRAKPLTEPFAAGDAAGVDLSALSDEALRLLIKASDDE